MYTVSILFKFMVQNLFFKLAQLRRLLYPINAYKYDQMCEQVYAQSNTYVFTLSFDKQSMVPKTA